MPSVTISAWAMFLVFVVGAGAVERLPVRQAVVAALLGGFMLESDAKIVRAPERYMDERGTAMWNMVMAELGLDSRKVGAGETAPAAATCPAAGQQPVPA